MKRWTVVGTTFLIAGGLGALFCLSNLSPVVEVVDVLWCWGAIMTGPVQATVSGHQLFSGLALTGWCGLLLGLAHPVKPGPWTATVSVLGWALWYASGWLTLLVLTQAT